MAGTLPFQVAVSHGAEILVDKGYQSLERFLVAGLPFGEEFANDLRRVLSHAVRHRMLSCR